MKLNTKKEKTEDVMNKLLIDAAKENLKINADRIAFNIAAAEDAVPGTKDELVAYFEKCFEISWEVCSQMNSEEILHRILMEEMEMNED